MKRGLDRTARGWMLLVGLGATACCGTPPGADQVSMNGRYPPESKRADILAKKGAPDSRHLLSEEKPGSVLLKYADAVRNETGKEPFSCDLYYMSRASSIPAAGTGVDVDYVFYTQDEVLIQARRRRLD